MEGTKTIGEFSDKHFKRHIAEGQKKMDEAPDAPEYFHDNCYPFLRPNNPNHDRAPEVSPDDVSPAKSDDSEEYGTKTKHSSKHNDAGHSKFGKHGSGSRNDHGRHDHGQGNSHRGSGGANNSR